MKSYGHLSKILANFSPDLSLIILMAHVVMAANLKKNFISPGFPINFRRKVTKFQRMIPKPLKVMDKNLWGGSLPGLNSAK